MNEVVLSMLEIISRAFAHVKAVCVSLLMKLLPGCNPTIDMSAKRDKFSLKFLDGLLFQFK